MVSIIMPAYNAEMTIKTSVDFVLLQTYEDWELIIIDDASTDSTASNIPDDPRITVITNEHNMGIARSRNIGLSRAQGDYFAFLDSDDIWKKEKLEIQLDFMKYENAAISYTATAYMNAAGELHNYVLEAEKKLYYNNLLKRNLMSCSSVMVRRDAMIPFPEDVEMHEDYAVWLQILRKTGCAYGINNPLLIYRMYKNSRSGGRLTSALLIYRTYRHVGYGLFTSVFYTLRYASHSIHKRFLIEKE